MLEGDAEGLELAIFRVFGVLVGVTQQKRTTRTMEVTTEDYQWYGNGTTARDANGNLIPYATVNAAVARAGSQFAASSARAVPGAASSASAATSTRAAGHAQTQ